MIFRFVAGLTLAAVLSLNAQANSLEGFWIDNNGRTIAEVLEDRILITWLTIKPDNQYVVDYQRIDDTRFSYTSNGSDVERFFTVDWGSGTFSMPRLIGEPEQLHFQRPLSLTKADLLGKWHPTTGGSNGTIHSITEFTEELITGTYLKFDNENKTYIKTKSAGYRYRLLNGFIIERTLAENGRKFKTYLRLDEDDSYILMGEDGWSTAISRKVDPVEFTIPDGYREVQFVEGD